MDNDDERQKFATIRAHFRNQIEHEDNLVGLRNSWLVGSQSFLLGTYVFLVNSPYDYISSGSRQMPVPGAIEVIHKTASGVTPNPISLLSFDTSALSNSVITLRYVMPAGGVLISVATYQGVIAAMDAILELRRHYAENVKALDDKFGDEFPPIMSSEKNRFRDSFRARSPQ